MIENANKNEEELIQKASDEKEADTLKTDDGKEDVAADIKASETENNENLADEAESNEGKVIKMDKVASFFGSLLGIAIDEIVVLGISAALLYISNFVMQFLGYYISAKLDMLFILFLILNIIYTAIMEASKFSGTLGKLVANLKVYKLGE